jgi:steroid delta-isomerase-like uncharacterized protein
VNMCKFADEYNSAWNDHDVEKVVSYFADDGVLDDVASGAMSRGIDDVRRAVTEWLTAFPDMHSRMEGACVATDGVVAYEWRLRATNGGPFDGHEATGKPMELRGTAILELDGENRITRHSDYVDSATILKQLGHA